MGMNYMNHYTEFGTNRIRDTDKKWMNGKWTPPITNTIKTTL